MMLPFHRGDLIQPLHDDDMVFVTMDNDHIEALARHLGSYAAAAAMILTRDSTWHSGMRRTKTTEGAVWAVSCDPRWVTAGETTGLGFWFFQVAPVSGTQDRRSTFWVFFHPGEFQVCTTQEEWTQ